MVSSCQIHQACNVKPVALHNQIYDHQILSNVCLMCGTSSHKQHSLYACTWCYKWRTGGSYLHVNIFQGLYWIVVWLFFWLADESEWPELIFHRSPLFLFLRYLFLSSLPSPWLRSCQRLLIFQNMLPGSKWDATFLSLLSGKQSRLLSLTLRCPAGSSPQSAGDAAEILIMRRRRSQFRRTQAASRHDTCSQVGRSDWHEQRRA